MWIIPVNRERNDQFSLRPYDESCYLTDINVSENIGKAVLAKGGGNDVTDFYRLQHNPDAEGDDNDQHNPNAEGDGNDQHNPDD